MLIQFLIAISVQSIPNVNVLAVDHFDSRCYWQSMLSAVDDLEIDVLVVDVLELDVLGAHQITRTLKVLLNAQSSLALPNLS